MSGSDVEGHMTPCFAVSNMAAEDLPSEFDVVILGTGRDQSGICWNADPDRVSVGVSLGCGNHTALSGTWAGIIFMLASG